MILTLLAQPQAFPSDRRPRGFGAAASPAVLGMALAALLAVNAPDAAGQNAARDAEAQRSTAPATQANPPARSRPPQPQPAREMPRRRPPMPGVTPEREAAVMTLVEQHHPELTELLKHLKAHKPGEYRKAIQALFRTSERLAGIQERDFERYQLELRLWKAESRAQLLGAKLKMDPSPALLEQLEGTLAEHYDVKLLLLKRERERQQQRIQRLQKQIDAMTHHRDQALQRQLRMYARQAGGPRPPRGQNDAQPAPSREQRGGTSRERRPPRPSGTPGTPSEPAPERT